MIRSPLRRKTRLPSGGKEQLARATFTVRHKDKYINGKVEAPTMVECAELIAETLGTWAKVKRQEKKDDL